jgi:hypothetical protein
MIFYKYKYQTIKIHLGLLGLIVVNAIMLSVYILRAYSCTLTHDPVIENILKLAFTIIFETFSITALTFLAMGFPLVIDSLSCNYIVRSVIIMILAYLFSSAANIFVTAFPILVSGIQIALFVFYLGLTLLVSWNILSNVTTVNEVIENTSNLPEIRDSLSKRRKPYITFGSIIVAFLFFMAICELLIFRLEPRYKTLQRTRALKRLLICLLLWVAAAMHQPKNFTAIMHVGIEVTFIIKLEYKSNYMERS